MPFSLDIIADVSDGHLDARTRRQIAANLGTWDGRQVRVRTSEPVRSPKQNAFYWVARVAPVCHALTLAGRTTPDWAVHGYLKDRWLPVVAMELLHDTGELVDYLDEGEVNGVPFRRITTTRLSVQAFRAFVACVESDDMVLALGIDFDVPVPEKLRSGRIAEPS